MNTIAMICIIVLGMLVGILLATTIKYRSDYNKTMALLDKATKNEIVLTTLCDTNKQLYELTKAKYETMKKEHDIIFANLEEDAMYLVRAKNAHKDLCAKLSEELANKISGANLLYNSTSENHYNRETEEITLSLFCDHNDEQIEYMYDYLNDKYETNLNGYDVRTNMIFTALHELGHHIDYSNKKDTDEYDSYVKLNWNQKEIIYDMEDGPKCWQAYREVPTESFADNFAINFMIKHYPELV